MKTLKYILAFFVFISFSSQSIAQQRNVHWVHGMGGSSGDLKQLNEYFNARRQTNISSAYRPSYSTDIGIRLSGEDLYNTPFYGGTNDIVVTHSMGGVNSHYMEKNHPGQIGGIITLVAPHGGAIVANNIANGTFHNFIVEAVDKGTSGIRTSIAVVLLNSAINFFNFVKQLWNGTPTMNLNDAIQWSIDKLDELVHGIVLSDATLQSLRTTSTDIVTLKNHDMNIPMIALYGNENYPATVRMFGTQATNGDDVPIGATNDALAVYGFDAIHNFCDSQVDICNTAGWVNFWNPMGWYWFSQADKYQISADYWGGQFQTGLDWMIGATRYQSVTNYREVLVCDDLPYLKLIAPPPDDGGDPDWIPPDNCHYEWEPYTTYVVVSVPSDGLLPVESQVALKGVGATRELTGVNHQESKKSWQTVYKLNDIFNGSAYDPLNSNFFKVPLK